MEKPRKRSDVLKEYRQGIRVEDFNEEELEFLEKLSKFSKVQTSINKLDEYTSLAAKEEFCDVNKSVLDSRERLQLENFYLEKRNLDSYKFPIGIGSSCSLFIYYAMTRPKTHKLNFDFLKSLMLGGVSYGFWVQAVAYRHRLNITDTFNRIMDLRVSEINEKKSAI